LKEEEAVGVTLWKKMRSTIEEVLGHETKQVMPVVLGEKFLFRRKDIEKRGRRSRRTPPPGLQKLQE